MTPTDTDSKSEVANPRTDAYQRSATSSALRWRLMWLSLLFLTLGVGGYWWANRQEPLATLLEYRGTTERDRVHAVAQWQPARIDDTFEAGEAARTSAAAEARFELLGGAKLALRPESIVRFHRRSPSGPIRVDVEMGEVDVQSGAGALTIDSEFGALVLDANSSVTLSRQGSSLLVDVELGSIQINQRAVAAGSSLTLELGGIVVDVPAPEPLAPAATTLAESTSAAPELELGDGVSYVDLVLNAGSTVVVHDPTPPTAVGVTTSGICRGPARLRSGNLVTEGVGQLNLRLPSGQNAYEVVCLEAPNEVVARGRVSILRDSGTQRLPQFAPTANVVTDGRLYTVMYQHKLPNVSISWPTAPEATNYTLTVDSRVFTTKTPHHTLYGLAAGRHKVTFSAATSPARASRSTTVEVQRDAQAPTGEVAEPPVGFAPTDSVTVRGNALPGWAVSVGGKELPLNAQRSFEAPANGTQTISIVFTHPTYGTHYYLRRPQSSP